MLYDFNGETQSEFTSADIAAASGYMIRRAGWPICAPNDIDPQLFVSLPGTADRLGQDRI